MRISAASLFLTAVWVLASGRFSAADFLLGFASSFAVLAFWRSPPRSPLSPRVLKHALPFAVYYVTDLIKACVDVARLVFVPLHRLRPAVVEVPIESRTDAEIALLANLLSYSPGTLTLEVSEDGRHLYVHVMSMQDAEALRRQVREELERRVLEVLR